MWPEENVRESLAYYYRKDIDLKSLAQRGHVPSHRNFEALVDRDRGVGNGSSITDLDTHCSLVHLGSENVQGDFSYCCNAHWL